MTTNNFTNNLKSLYIKEPINQMLINRYVKKGQMTFFNWEFFEQKLVKNGTNYRFQFDYDLKKTKTFNRIDNELQFGKLLPINNPKITYWKIIPDEEIPILWPEVVLKTGAKQFNKDITNFKDKMKRYCQKISPNIKVELLSGLIERYSLGKTYFDSYWKIYSSFDKNYNSPLVKRKDFLEDINFRKTHYSDKPVLSERLVKEYAVKMFAVYAAETSVLCALQNNGILPNLVLVSNESERAIKKYETLAQLEKRPIMPKIFVL